MTVTTRQNRLRERGDVDTERMDLMLSRARTSIVRVCSLAEQSQTSPFGCIPNVERTRPHACLMGTLPTTSDRHRGSEILVVGGPHPWMAARHVQHTPMIQLSQSRLHGLCDSHLFGLGRRH